MASPATCPLPGQPAMYGLGIRAAFYVQWFGLILVEYMDETELADLRLLSVLSSAAAALSVTIHAADADLQPADVYLTLLLASGIYIFLVPVWIWRALTCFMPYWNPLRWSRETHTPVFRGANFVLLVVIASLWTWFWLGWLAGEEWECAQWGFFFGQVALGSRVFIGFNALLWLLVLLACFVLLLVASGCEIGIWRKKRRRSRRKAAEAVPPKELTTFSHIFVAAVLVAAVELTIAWNTIPNVDSLTDVAQTLPLFVSAGILVRTVFMHFVSSGNDSSTSAASTEIDVQNVREARDGYFYYAGRYWRGPAGEAEPRPPPPAARR